LTIPRSCTASALLMRVASARPWSHLSLGNVFGPWAVGMSACSGFALGEFGARVKTGRLTMRGARGERRALEKAPGHLFERVDQEDCLRFLAQVMENAWDADVIVVPKIK